MGSRLFKVARVGVLDADIYSPLRPDMLGIAATAARSFHLAAPAWKPNVPSPSRQLARGGFLPYGIPRLGQVACQAADRRPPPRIVSEWIEFVSYRVAGGSWHLSNYKIATFASYLSFRRVAEGGCWCL